MAIKERPNKPKKKARAKITRERARELREAQRETEQLRLHIEKTERLFHNRNPKVSTRATMPTKPKAAKKSQPSPRPRAAVPKPPSPPARPRGPLVLKPGIHAGVAHLDYHRDPAPRPSMSSSFLRAVYDSSCRHAWLTHPRLNPNWKEETPSREMEFGTAAHAHLLQSQLIQIVRFPDWRTDTAKLIRDRARAAGMAPVLERDAVRIGEMARRLREGLKGTDLEGVFDPKLGVAEAVAIWVDEGVYFRARADKWIAPAPGAFPHGLIIDYKSTGLSASAESWSNAAFGIGADWQSVLYPEGFVMAWNQERKARRDLLQLPEFRYVVQEDFEPYEFQVFAPSTILREHTKGKISAAFAMVHSALKSPDKPPPGYPRLTAMLEPPAWELKRAERAAISAQLMWRPS